MTPYESNSQPNGTAADGKVGNNLPSEFVMATATFAAGCFWGIEEAFRQVEGVTAATAGYSGGTVENPPYKAVCSRQGMISTSHVVKPTPFKYEGGIPWRES